MAIEQANSLLSAMSRGEVKLLHHLEFDFEMNYTCDTGRTDLFFKKSLIYEPITIAKICFEMESSRFDVNTKVLDFEHSTIMPRFQWMKENFDEHWMLHRVGPLGRFDTRDIIVKWLLYACIEEQLVYKLTFPGER